MKFTDANGATTHGIAITVCDEVSVQSREMNEFVNELLEFRRRRAAVRTINHWWKHANDVRRKCFKRCDSKAPDHNVSWRRITYLLSSKKRMSCNSDGSDDGPSRTNKQDQSWRDQSWRDQSWRDQSWRDQSWRDEVKDSPGNSCDDDFNCSGFLDWNGDTHRDDSDDDFAYEGNSSKESSALMKARTAMGNAISEKAKRLGKEAFEAMNTASEMGDMCVIEKCYVLIGGKQSEQLLHLRLLHNMIQEEQEVKSILNKLLSLIFIVTPLTLCL